jgi:hypothetical protein
MDGEHEGAEKAQLSFSRRRSGSDERRRRRHLGWSPAPHKQKPPPGLLPRQSIATPAGIRHAIHSSYGNTLDFFEPHRDHPHIADLRELIPMRRARLCAIRPHNTSIASRICAVFEISSPSSRRIRISILDASLTWQMILYLNVPSKGNIMGRQRGIKELRLLSGAHFLR